MASGLFVGWEPDNPDGEKLPPEFRAEVAIIAPATVSNGAITEPKIGTAAVTNAKIADGAVGPSKLASGAVGTGQLANAAVGTSKLAPNAVTPDKTGTGVVTAYDANGDAIAAKIVPMTSTTYAGITPDPDTFYATWTA